MTMDAQTKKELLTLKIVAVGMPIMLCIAVIFFGGHIWWAQKLSNPVVDYVKVEGVEVTLCGISLYDLDSIAKAFDEITTIKVGGSFPVSLYFFKVETPSESYVLQLGQDSRSSELFWVYPEGGKLNTIVGGWIKSEYIAEKYIDCG
jgi:hypothetical protein